MPFISNVMRFARSPQGKKLTQQAMRMAKDPKTRAKIADTRKRMAERRPPR
jgi:hypothetical protein